MLHGGGMTVVSNVIVAVEALCVIDVNFTTGIETGRSFMASRH